MKTKHRRDIQSKVTNVGLSKTFELRLTAYAIAAGSAGVALLAAATPAAAEVIYTPTHIVFDGGAVYLDLNHDGVNDFALSIYNFDSVDRRLAARALAQNGVLCYGSSGYPPVALKAGYRIGANDNYGIFDRRGAPGVNVFASKFGTNVSGPFANTGERFLGLKFKINGEVHYGWALLRVGAGIVGNRPAIRATLLGYAYETVAGQAIGAGQGATKAENSEALPQAGTLGMLALGWPAWLRKEDEGEKKI